MALIENGKCWCSVSNTYSARLLLYGIALNEPIVGLILVLSEALLHFTDAPC